LLLWPTLIYVYLFVLLRIGDIDREVAGLFAGSQQPGFPLRHAYLTEFLLHDVAQAAMKGIVVLLLLAWLGSWLNGYLARRRRELGYLLLSVVLSVGLVGLGKQVTNVDCPWDLQAFGGQRIFYDLFDNKPAGAPVGRCFPGGHSASGFALFGLFFLLRRRRPSHAALGLLPALLLGAGFAVVQWVRGAHFPSHDLTTAYVCWLTALACAHWVFHVGEPEGRRPG
jgi:membrane-associated PAP2 superfamily phosphatase